jgi:cysteine desulfurase
VGLGKACEIAEHEYKDHNRKNDKIKACIISAFDESGLKYGFNGDQDYCINSTVNIHIDAVSSEALMLSSKQFCGVSNGSACNSKSYEPSYVLTAMGIPEDVIENSIRISWGANTDPVELKDDFSQLLKIAANIK